MNTASLIPLVIILPFLGAAATFLLTKHPKIQLAISALVLVCTLSLDISFLAQVWDGGTMVVWIGGWEAPWGIALVVDQFAALMLVVSTAIGLAVLLYAAGQGATDSDSGGPISIFQPTYLILMAGVSNAFLAGDLFNLYVGFEILLTASYVLMTLGGTGPRIRAGITYVVVSVISSILFLIAIAMIYGATGTVNFADLAIKLQQLDEGTRTVLHLMLLIAFGIKAAVFPLSFWLPDSYPTAPAPVTAVFAGLLTKVGVYAMVRTETLLFPGGALNNFLLIVSLLTMVVGILGALAQTDIKRLLSFTLVSHIGYMIFGLAIASQVGLGAAVFYVAHHITIQTSLFLVTGLVEMRGGTTTILRLGGLAKLTPLLGVLFFTPAMNLAGIPPFSGFIGKLGLLQAGVESGTGLAWALVIGSVAVSLLTLLAISRVWSRAFWRSPEEAEDPAPALVSELDTEGLAGRKSLQMKLKPGPKLMVAATGALVTMGLLLTVFAGPLVQFTNSSASQMLNREEYIKAVRLVEDAESPLMEHGDSASSTSGENPEGAKR